MIDLLIGTIGQVFIFCLRCSYRPVLIFTAGHGSSFWPACTWPDSLIKDFISSFCSLCVNVSIYLLDVPLMVFYDTHGLQRGGDIAYTQYITTRTNKNKMCKRIHKNAIKLKSCRLTKFKWRHIIKLLKSTYKIYCSRIVKHILIIHTTSTVIQ